MARTKNELVVDNADCIKPKKLADGRGGGRAYTLTSPSHPLPPPQPTPPRPEKSYLSGWLFFFRETDTKRVTAWRVPALPHITRRLSTAREGRSHECSGDSARRDGAAGLEASEDRRVEPRRSRSSPATCKRKETTRGEELGLFPTSV